MSRLLLIFVALCCLDYARSVSVSINFGITGWYWKDVAHQLPEHAFAAGVDSKGEKIYVGQAAYFGGSGSLLTGAYVPRENKVFFEYGKQQLTSDRNNKVLCSLQQKYFKWVGVKKDEDIKHKHLVHVPGGIDKEYDLAIGRISGENQQYIGKVVIINNHFENFYYNKDGAGLVATEYEVLYFDDEAEHEVNVNIN